MNACRSLLLLTLLAACSPGFEEVSEVEDLRLLAVRAEPPEMVYKVILEGEGAPRLDLPSLVPPPVELTLLVANPGRSGPVFYRVEGCLLDDNLACREDALRVPLGEGEAEAGEIALPVVLPPDLILASFQEDPFLGIYGAAVWLTGEVSYGDEQTRFLKAFVLAPDYGQGRVANSNPAVTGLMSGDKDEESPLSLPLAVATGEELRFLPAFPEGVRESYTVKALDLAGLTFAPDQQLDTILKRAYDKEYTEELRVSYYATCGGWSRNSASEALVVFLETKEEADKDLAAIWSAPAKPGDCSLWFVVDDGRGGIGWYLLSIAVK